MVNKGLPYVGSGPAERLNDSLATELRKRSGHIVKLLGPEELRELEPSLSSEFTHIVLLPETAHATNPHRLVCSISPLAVARS